MKSKAKHLAVVFITIGIIALIAISCDQDDDVIVPDQVPTLTTTAVFNISENAATSGGNISDNYDSPITARGVCWSTEPDPNVSDSKTVDGLGIGPFESNITGLAPGQTYYVRAYATNASGTGYGSAIQFLTIGGGGSTVTDPDGNTYNTVAIGTQIWLKENLATTKYNDGSPIPHITEGNEWQNHTEPAYCWYDDDYDQFGTVFGALYNYHADAPASNGNKNVCPTGWHVPSIDEFEVLVEYLGGTGIAGGKMKEVGTEHWASVNVGATNESGFTALGTGGIGANYWFNMYWATGFWTTTPAPSNENYGYYLRLEHGTTFTSLTNTAPRWNGTSVRCIKD